MKKTLPSIRVEERDIEMIDRAILKFNKNNVLDMNIQGFRRLSYKLLIQMILSGEPIPIQFKG